MLIKKRKIYTWKANSCNLYWSSWVLFRYTSAIKICHTDNCKIHFFI